jgi:hypothetical protein
MKKIKEIFKRLFAMPLSMVYVFLVNAVYIIYPICWILTGMSLDRFDTKLSKICYKVEEFYWRL